MIVIESLALRARVRRTKSARSLNRIREEIARSEKSVYQMETKYLVTTQRTGNIVRGWDALIKTQIMEMNGTSFENHTSLKVRNVDRVFSSSSVSSEANEKTDHQ